jgi:hypothetical protein
VEAQFGALEIGGSAEQPAAEGEAPAEPAAETEPATAAETKVD